MKNDEHVSSKCMAPSEYEKRKLWFGESVGSSKEKKYQLLCISISMILLAIVIAEGFWINQLHKKYDDKDMRSLSQGNRELIAELNRSLLEKEAGIEKLSTSLKLCKKTY